MKIRSPKYLKEWFVDRFFLTKDMRIRVAQQELGNLHAVFHVILGFGIFALFMNYGILRKSFQDSKPELLYYSSYLLIGFFGILLVSALKHFKSSSFILNCIPYYIPFFCGYSLCCYVFLHLNSTFTGIVGFATMGLVSIMCLQINPVIFCVVLAVIYGVIFNNIRIAHGLVGVMDVGVLNLLFMGLAFLKRGNVKYTLLRTQTLKENSDVMRLELAEQSEEIHNQERMLEKQHQRIIDIQNNTIISLSNLVENRDSDTGEHVRRTSAYVNLIAVKAKANGVYEEQITDSFIELATKAAPMHDIGKITVPDRILKKPGKLTEEEFAEVKKHTVEGARIVYEIFGGNEDKEYVEMTKDIALCHHECWDGSGYPEGLKGEEIPLAARIMAIADVFDALVSPRCYKQSFSIEKAMQIIREESGTHFDPKLAELFLSMEDDALAIMDRYKD